MRNGRFHTALADRGVLVADGAMGTTLFSLGLEGGGCPELLNVERPSLVADVHRRFAAAGSDVVLTNTFGGNARRLALHGASHRVRELNVAAASIAHRSADGTLVAGSVGPTGDLLEPLGTLSRVQAVEVFSEQIEALVEGGVDVVWIETISSIEELSAAVEAANRFDRPIVATLSFDTAGHTMMGVSGVQLGSWALADGRLDGVGANCGIGPGDAVAAVFDITSVAPDIVAVAKPNCGMPLYETDRLVYPIGPEGMADFVDLAVRSGARVVGTCCGSTPEHIAAVREAVDAGVSGGRPDRHEIEERLSARPLESGVQRRRRRG
ncbi:MAG TPA: betaine--homocysteine S-methyltransferase [Acidimicrobiia bacterium]|nr:betaine--homocysteine S-methyltransferase [Acidimicrobiia bacterium]